MKEIEYKHNEDKILKSLKEYIDSTYDQHYSKTRIQAIDVIMDAKHGRGFCIGNLMKYLQRYGKKNGRNINDLYKILHYSVLLFYNEIYLEDKN